MISIGRLSRIVAALAAFTLPSLALAGTTPTPQEVVQECAAQMRAVAEDTAGDIRDGAHAAVDHIRMLEMNGATNEQIRMAAREAMEGVRERGGQGAQEVQALAAACVQTLQGMQAPQQAFLALHNARGRALGAIHTATQAGVRAIARAAAHAIGNEA